MTLGSGMFVINSNLTIMTIFIKVFFFSHIITLQYETVTVNPFFINYLDELPKFRLVIGLIMVAIGRIKCLFIWRNSSLR